MEEFKTNQLTAAGKRAFEEELEELRVVKRAEIAQKIKEAREQGDLSENAEYDAAKDEQRDIEARISELEEILKNAEVVSFDGSTVSIGCAVTVYDYEFEEEVTYTITGSDEANIRTKRVSNESPFGKAIVGKHAGDEFSFSVNGNDMKYKVISITEA